MKTGNIKLLDFDLNLCVEDDKIAGLVFGDVLPSWIGESEMMGESESLVWQNRIYRGDYQLSFHGSDFDKLVWGELVKLRCGETITYKQLAIRLGMPKAVRAVANAVGRNRIAILVPCHRIIRSDGDLGGFYWGVEIKREILKKECSL